MLLGAALPLVGAAALPAVGEAAVAMGAPALATRAVTGAAGGALFGKMGMATSMVAREAQYQVRSGMEQEAQQAAPPPQGSPVLDQLLHNNDLTPFPNINRAMQQPDGRPLLEQLFFERVDPTRYNHLATPVDPKSLLTPTGGDPGIPDGVSITGPSAPDEF